MYSIASLMRFLDDNKDMIGEEEAKEIMRRALEAAVLFPVALGPIMKRPELVSAFRNEAESPIDIQRTLQAMAGEIAA